MIELRIGFDQITLTMDKQHGDRSKEYSDHNIQSTHTLSDGDDDGDGGGNVEEEEFRYLCTLMCYYTAVGGGVLRGDADGGCGDAVELV